ncbi:hypothetical protein Syun_004401 [Stephania yunnanensis]|uniref:Uncharacterized protein n=1 Tax=Stephania yunnanensis TaxID=152371 RepID=A0AAP0L745_9MAGN
MGADPSSSRPGKEKIDDYLLVVESAATLDFDTIDHLVRDSVDDLVVDPVGDSALPEIDDRVIHTHVLMMMLLHLHILVRASKLCINILRYPLHPSMVTTYWSGAGARARAGAGDGVESSRPISAPNEHIELLRRDFKEMQTNFFRVVQDNALIRDEL